MLSPYFGITVTALELPVPARDIVYWLMIEWWSPVHCGHGMESYTWFESQVSGGVCGCQVCERTLILTLQREHYAISVSQLCDVSSLSFLTNADSTYFSIIAISYMSRCPVITGLCIFVCLSQARNFILGLYFLCASTLPERERVHSAEWLMFCKGLRV